MTLRPATVRELAGMLVERTYAAGQVLVTGSPHSRRGEETGEILSTASLAGVSAYEPADMTVTVGAGMRVAELQTLLAERDQWLPVSVCAPGRSVGGLVAAALPGRYDWSYGPVRRHVLGCRMVTPRGTLHRWGRAVMKNVAGYDMRALMCGSRARLGVLTEVSFRVWVRPSCVLDITLSGETGPGGPLHVLCSEPAPDADWRPDAVSWSASGAEAASLVVRLEGSESSVHARAARLHRMARENGWTTAQTTPGAVVGTGAHGDEMAEMQRSIEVRAYRATVARDYLSSAVERVRAAFGDQIDRLVAFPLGGIVRAEVRVTDVSESGNGALETFARAVDAERHRAAIAVERGSSSDLAAADERRATSSRRLESRVVQALGGCPRHWRGDYL